MPSRSLFVIYPSLVTIALLIVVLDMSFAQLLSRDTHLILAVTLTLIAVSTWLAARKFRRALVGIQQGVDKFTGGDLTHRIALDSTTDFVQIAEKLNQMAAKLDLHLQQLLSQKNEIGAVLDSMSEGVIVVDHQARIVRINRAAGDLLGIDDLEIGGKLVYELVRNSSFQRFVEQALSSGRQIESEITLAGKAHELHYLRCQATPLESDSKTNGAVIVLSDISEYRRLELMRREFVANVSHELKTPITSIRGSVETLLDGASDNPADRQKFLQVISRHTARLNDIIDDLLRLSKIERDKDADDVKLELKELRPIIDSALQLCANSAAAKNITVKSSIPTGASARVVAPLLEQGITNLLDNAIKYSETQEPIDLSVKETPSEVVIAVSDRGKGIAAEHIPRLFERFYRVDTSRSRNVGGTGLGLAIVKHIAQLHNGTATVESTPGEGATFSIHLPRYFGEITKN